MTASNAADYAEKYERAWQRMDDRIAELERLYRALETEAAVYVASELCELRRPLIAAAADAGTFADAYRLGREEERAEIEAANRITVLRTA